MAKRGRKRNHYTTTGGDTIVGLGQLSDGRWVDLEDRAHPWSCGDERDAVREFHRRRSARRGDQLSVTLRHFPLERIDDEVETALKPDLEITIRADDLLVECPVPAQAVWDLLGRLVRENPKVAAERTGIKALAWLQDLQPPPPPLMLSEIRDLYAEKRFSDSDEQKRSLRCWDEFCAAVAPAASIKEVQPEHLQKYHAQLSAQNLSPKTHRNRYAKVGSILRHAYNLKPAHRAALQSLRTDFNLICRAGRGQVGQPDPIEVDDFGALYRAADARWRAILLCMLNFAMHPKEAGELLKEELNPRMLELRSTRTKTFVRRVGKVWPETARAVREYQATQVDNAEYETSPMLFLTALNKPYAKAGLGEYFRDTLKPRAEKLAGRKLSCTLDSIRDGAQNAADLGGADSIHTEMLMGHALPGSMGNYKVRAPAKTAQSVHCIYEHYGIAQLTSQATAATAPAETAA